LRGRLSKYHSCAVQENNQTLQSGSESVDVVPVIQSLLPLNEVIELPNFFDALDIVLLSVDASTGEALRDDNGDLIKYNFGNTNWIPLMNLEPRI